MTEEDRTARLVVFAIALCVLAFGFSLAVINTTILNELRHIKEIMKKEVAEDARVKYMILENRSITQYGPM